MTSQERYTIIDGPGKWDFILALFDDQMVTFTLKEIKEISELNDRTSQAWVDSLTRTDKQFLDREAWLMEGLLRGGYVFGIDYNCVRFKGYYDIRRRQGWIEPAEPYISRRD